MCDGDGDHDDGHDASNGHGDCGDDVDGVDDAKTTAAEAEEEAGHDAQNMAPSATDHETDCWHRWWSAAERRVTTSNYAAVAVAYQLSSAVTPCAASSARANCQAKIA